ncbi:MAG: hypothetical protein P8N52_08640 [Crocinitomicaceae bacterium]|nr:hypothetical protein [Crocinitomicaceae bacterium]MDG1776775.1 hypothetical protein [Crocinitomicaceae bacterium]
MKTKISMKKIASLFFLACTFVSYGQPGVTVIASGDRYIEPVYRVALSPRVIDTTIKTAIVEYPLLVLKHETQTEVNQINPASIKTIDKLPPFYNTYIKLGVGTELMPIGEVFFDAGRSRKHLYGGHVKHLSSFGSLKGYAPSTFDRTKVNVYGGINERRYSLRGDIHYNNQGLHYYSVSDTLGLERDSIAQRYSDAGFKASFKSHKKDSSNVNYQIGLSYNNYLSKTPNTKEHAAWRARENFVEITSTTWYKQNKETFAADLNVRYNGYRYGVPDSSLTGLGSGVVLNNTVVNLKPTITTTLQDNRFKAKVGLDLTLDVHNTTRVYIYPIAEIKYSMFNDIFIPYAGIRGGLTQNTFKRLTQKNEFLLANVYLKNEKRPVEFYGGIKGTLSKRMSFNAGVTFANVRDKALFVTDYTHRNKFNVIYDTINTATIDASISYQLKEQLKIDALGRFNSYTALNNSYAWNLPRLEFLVRGSYNLFNKFLFKLDLTLEEGRKALVYEMDDDVTVENGQYIKSLGFITDLNLGVEYRYNKRISAFIEFNNVASQRYKRWYNTPVHSFQFLGGVTFRL